MADNEDDKDKPPEPPDQFDLFGGKEDRDEALSQVAKGSPDYISGGMTLIANMQNGTEVIGEDIRLKCIEAGLRYHHYNVHGSLIKLAVDRGLLRRTGRSREMKVRHNHARQSPIYYVRSINYQTPPEAPPLATPTAPTNAVLDDGKVIKNKCAVEGCEETPSRSIGFFPRQGKLGLWYCEKHWPGTIEG